ncbi:MAG TPA: lipopolysaccharide transport periplasmic protein LptA [Deltaproteobacteria bacterium]|nr:lipopolysaccharide transport periplasmic protein LptA [Deltaproteobacteria bacterium]HOI06751.1 lipopolysaccharide transport periplasmic protein LptA [Deltaproteobacteria bacterium]
MLISLLCLCWALAAAAADAKPKATGLKSKKPASEMIDVEADRLEVNKEKGEAVFRGNVKATQGDVVIRGSTLTLFIDKATNKVDRLIAEKNVFIRWEDKDSTSDRAVYTISKRHLELTGNAVITRGPERVAGEKIVIDMLSNRQTVEGGKDSRVKIRVKGGSEETGVFQWK